MKDGKHWSSVFGSLIFEWYDGCYLYSSLIMKNEYLWSKLVLLFFKVFSMKINALLHAFEPIFEALFLLDWGNCKACVLNASTASSGVENHCPCNLFLFYGNKRKKKLTGCHIRAVQRMIHQLFWHFKKFFVWVYV